VDGQYEQQDTGEHDPFVDAQYYGPQWAVTP
jgi:hypothetical protein